MSKVKKATKKFNQKKSKGSSSPQFKRKGPHHHKHGHNKHAANGGVGAGKGSHPSAAAAADDEQQQQAAKRVEEMDMDEFLDGGFEAAAAAGSDDNSGDSDADQPSSSELGSDDDVDLDDVISDDDEEEEGDAVMMAAAAAAAGSDEDEQQQSDGSDDDDDGGAGAGAGEVSVEAAAVAADNKRLKGAVSRHKQQLEDLKNKDPEFYKYLQATDAELLGFGDDDEDDEEEEEEDSDDEDSADDEAAAAPRKAAAAAAKGKEKPSAAAATKKDKQKAAKAAAAAAAADGSDDDDDDDDAEQAGSEEEEDAGQKQQQQDVGGKQALQVTSSLVDSWTQSALDKASLGAMMQLVKAYRVACHYGDTEQEMSSSLVSITSGAVFNKVLLFMLKEADGIFRRMLGLQQDSTTAAAAAAAGGEGGDGAAAASGGAGVTAATKPSVLLAEQVTKAQRWRKIEPLVKSYLGNSIHLLSTMTQPAMTAFTLRRLRASAAFLGPFGHLNKKLMRMGLKLYGSEEQGPRLQALLLVRQMSLVLPPPAGQSVLRGAYRSFVSSAKFVSPASLPTLNFMAAGFVELSSLDPTVTYQVGFVAIRELAVLLRNALAAKTQDAHKEVYCWQTLMCLELWVKVLAAAGPSSPLQPLVYPTTQLLLGAARLVPTPRYFPIRLRLVRALNKLAQTTGVYVPVSPLLLEMLQWSELRKTPTGTAAAPDLMMLLRLSKTQLKTSALQEEVVSQVLEVLTEHLAQWSTSISFPELSHLPCVALRGFAKGCAVERFRKQAKQLVDALERNATYVGNARDTVSFAPQDLAAAAAFLSSDKERAQAPLSQYARQLLQKAAARVAMRSASTKEMQLGGKRKRRDHDDDDDSDNEEEDAGSSDEEGGAGQLRGAAAGEEDEEDDDEALGAAAKRMMRQKEKRLKRSAAAAAAAGGAGAGSSDDEEGAAGGTAAAAAAAGEDEVADYQLSDDDSDGGAAGGWGSDEEDEGGRKKKQKQQQQQRGRRSGAGGEGKKHKKQQQQHHGRDKNGRHGDKPGGIKGGKPQHKAHKGKGARGKH